ncbi:hypothetical protein PENDEC_c006G05753 [Penicillium decumbens]|uniref:Uncharacterized protein n=1 Tax=Penicillium decumbens TaxID=69771 RepID=A0A1V6PF78_PENDC|nr:hypothetical protein PENDEC_c006G05753 [Penicillium decumbens]
MSYDDIVEAQKKRDMMVAKQDPTREKRSKAEDKLLSKSEEKRKAEEEIQAWNMSGGFETLREELVKRPFGEHIIVGDMNVHHPAE